jgi:hypothetical protein
MNATTATKTTTLTIGKLDAARRQLSTAITLWFGSDDPVSIHTLAHAAYEIIHTVSRKRNPDRRGDEWSFCLIAARMAADQERVDDETSAPSAPRRSGHLVEVNDMRCPTGEMSSGLHKDGIDSFLYERFS